MPIFEPASVLRNISFVGHNGSGKTSVIEAILYSLGNINRLGNVEEGNTVADYLPEEIKRKVSISAKVLAVKAKEYNLNLIDTPGYADFIGEVISSLNVIESVLYIVCGSSGVEVQTEIIKEYVEQTGVCQAVFINKLDRENSDFFRVIKELEDLFSKPVLPLCVPLGKESNLEGYIDLLTGEVISKKPKEAVYDKKQVAELRLKLVEAIVETDEGLLTKYLEEQEIEIDRLKQALKEAVKEGQIIPVIGGSATQLIGMEMLVNLLTYYLPEPKTNNDEKLAALVFKTMADPYVGRLSYLRVFSGTLKNDCQVYNFKKRKHEKIGGILKSCGKNQVSVSELGPGDIGIVPKLALTTTGDTIVKDSIQEVISVRTLSFPAPNFELAVEPKSKGDEEKLSSSLNKVVEEDPTLTVIKRRETNETIIKGMGEMHLETALERLSSKFGVQVVIKRPKIPYRETITSSIKVEGKHKKQTGGHGQYGHVWLQIEPAEEEFVFSEKVFGGAVPKQYIPAVEKGIIEAMKEGVLAGYPISNIRAILCDGSYHNVDSSELAFKIAASQAFKKGCLKANPVLLEPIYDMLVVVPEQFMGDIISNLNSRRGKIIGMESKDRKQEIKAKVPLSELQSYSTDLKSLTQGRGTYKVKFSHYDVVPPKKAEEIIIRIEQ